MDLPLWLSSPWWWFLRQVVNPVRRLAGQPLLEDERVQPVPGMALGFRLGAWGEPDLEGLEEDFRPASFTLAHLRFSAALSFREVTDEAAGMCGTLTQVLEAAPPMLFSPSGPARKATSGIDIVDGGPSGLGYAATWLVYRDGRALLASLYDPGRRPRVLRDARGLVDSVGLSG